ncbi:cytoskeletal protein CcmA (bactofilin family) [Christiangramia gaetbulicola]|uniref:Cytoskeletal protein CcmA (Bactofilin family) n=1 Tax=Christiangramia gaetbulicola TaxID=703340 RepID=A0A2T6AMM5_9FLAO|nr:polymer-forming cytoskeletal protein [Christiangramia gaetbulicola]PTX45068.1 cytoskeletal protein CcmA (bactofilin family) [Christiangramia gaetbulicola]
MFSESKKTKPASNQNEQNRIAAGTLITGEISGKGCFRIEGTLEGSLKTPGKVVISEGGLINGTLECDNADIEGRFKGKLLVKGVLTLRSPANLEGEVIAGKLAVEPGAIFNATCEMNGGVKPLKKENEKRSA